VYEKIGIFYFSGTGNTKKVAEILKKELISKNFSVNLLKIEDLIKSNPIEIKDIQNKFDMIGFGFVVHAFNAPRIVFQFIKNVLSDGKGKKAFVFKCSGDPLSNGGSTSMIRKRLKKKGYDVFYEKLFVMSANVFLKFDDNLNKQLYETSKIIAKKMVNAILNNERKLQKNSLSLRIITRIFSGMESFGVRFAGKLFKINKICTKCELCIKKCPMSNIRWKKTRRNEKISFGLKCILCMRCIYSCPVDAIHPRIFKFFKIKDGFTQKKLELIYNNPKIKENFITKETKGYFKHYYKWLQNETS
jgi:flavodoxin/ferredoxin